MGPLYKFGFFGHFSSLMVALVLGFWFGFLLERAGFGNPKKLTNMFYFKDFAVLKVMFTTVVVAMLGLLYFSLFGWIDFSKVYILPTFLWPHIVGGLLLGIGFIMGGYCPTTSIVATVSGKLDGLVFIFGMMFGVFAFAEIFTAITGYYNSGAMGVVRLPQILHLPSGVIAFLVCLIAIGAFWAGEKAEKKFQDFEPEGAPTKRFKVTGAIILVILGLVLMIANPDKAMTKDQEKVAPVEKSVIEAPKATETPAAVEKVPEVIIGDDEGC